MEHELRLAGSRPGGSEAIDLAHLRRFTLGNAELEAEVLQLFANETPATIGALRSAAEFSQWRRAAHTLKGSARAVGAWALADRAEAAEREEGWQVDSRRRVVLQEIDFAFQAALDFIHSQ